MNSSVDCGLIGFSVEVSDRGCGESTRQIRQAVQHAVRIFDRHRIAATWFLPEDDALHAVEPALLSDLSHEIGVTESGLGSPTGRRSVQQALRSRLKSIRDDGVAVETMLSTVATVPACLDSLSELGIVAVRVSGNSTRATTRCGVRLQPANAMIPAKFSLFPGGRQVQSQIRHAISRKSSLHCGVRLKASGTRRSLSAISHTLEEVAQARSRGVLCCETLSETASRVLRANAKGSRSILRRAA